MLVRCDVTHPRGYVLAMPCWSTQGVETPHMLGAGWDQGMQERSRVCGIPGACV